MPWNYGGNPLDNPRDAVRMYIGDTDPSDPLLQDGEINYFLSMYNNVPLNAAVQCCEAILAKFSRMVTEGVGGVSINFTDRVKNMQALRSQLIQRITMTDAAPYCGGINKTDVQMVNQNANRVPPDFTKQMMDNCQIAPWVSNGWYGPGGYGWGWGCGC